MMYFSPEHQFLIQACNPFLHHEDKTELNILINQGLNWQHVIQLAKWHGISQILYKNLLNLEKFKDIPLKVIKILNDKYQIVRIRNTIMLKEIEKVYIAIAAAKIPIMPLKGIFLAPFVYEDVGMRPMSDIDLLINKSDLTETERILSSCGYYLNKPELYDYCINKHYHVQYANPKRKIIVEIHWNIFSPNHFNIFDSKDVYSIERFWKRSNTYTDNRTSIEQLHQNDMIFVLSWHFMKHRFYSLDSKRGFVNEGLLLQLCDIDRTLNYFKENFCIRDYLKEIEAAGLSRAAKIPLFLVFNLFHWNRKNLNLSYAIHLNEKEKNIVDIIIRNLFVDIKPYPIQSSVFKISPKKLFSKPTKEIVNKAFPSPDNLSKRLNKNINKQQYFLHFITRPFILLFNSIRLILAPKRLRDEIRIKAWLG